MKLIFLAIICILFSYVGVKISLFYKRKVKITQELLDFTNNLILNISFLKTDLLNIISSYNTKNSEFKQILNSYKEYVENGSNLKFKKDINKYFAKDITDNIFNFFQNLGKLDYANQIKILEYNKCYFDELKNKAEKENKTKGSLYYKLGLIIGIGMMILLV